MHTRVSCTFLFVVPTLVASVGCTSGQSSNSPPPDVVSDAGAEASAGESLTVLVTALHPQPTGLVILPNASVVFAMPGGERVETQAGPDGLVTLTGIDWSKGTAALTVFAPELVVSSFVELTKDSVARFAADFSPKVPGDPKRDFTAYAIASETVTPGADNPALTGSVSNAEGSFVVLSTSIHGGVPWQGAPPGPYKLTVAPGRPFSVFALEGSAPAAPTVGPRGTENELKRWSKIDHAAVAGDTPFDLDLATAAPLTPIKVRGKLAVTGGNGGALGGSSKATVIVRTRESGDSNVVGVPSKIDVSADGNAFDFDLEYVKPEGASPLVHALIQLPDGGLSIVQLLDWPSEGLVVDGFPAPPVIRETSRSLADPFTIEGFEPGADGRVTFEDLRGPRWFITFPAGTKTFTPPQLDGAARTAVGKPTRGFVSQLAAPDTSSLLYKRAANSRRFSVK